MKPYQNLGPDLSPDCLLMFSVVLPPVVIEQPNIKEDRPGYSIKSHVSHQRPSRVKMHMTYEKLPNSKDMTAKHILPFHLFAGISFSKLKA